MNSYQKIKAKMEEFVSEGLDRHQMTNLPPVRCWCFQRVVDGKSRWRPYGFHFTWQPGVFSLFGDIGELQIVHYSAISADLKSSIEWLVDAEFDYLMSKSTVQKEYDRDATADLILQADYLDAVAGHLNAPPFNPNLHSHETWLDSLRDDVLGQIETEQDGGEFFRAITGDWSVCHRWPVNNECRIAAMQFAARWILDNEIHKEVA